MNNTDDGGKKQIRRYLLIMKLIPRPLRKCILVNHDWRSLVGSGCKGFLETISFCCYHVYTSPPPLPDCPVTSEHSSPPPQCSHTSQSKDQCYHSS
ncbi:hypothetical protein Pcinc_037253 [Petrolisthes cinctipes]|uniref:Uncharacterized protein n=1 Tax=Petrolisthes cinctipes TaxID=88211 RepID=A0AAE1BWC9_PETCI|nr:hypothetical protein Pcinc_037253 [Petrolisthes cinctipes]